MAKLIYVTNVSLDGYIEDEHGSFDWTPPEDDFFAFITDLVRPVGTVPVRPAPVRHDGRLGDRPALATQSELTADFANVWQAADKVVYSTTLDAVPTARTRLEHNFDPASVRDMKAAATSDSPWEARTSRRRLSRPGWSMSATCSSSPPRRRQARAAQRHSRRARAAGRSADSGRVSCTSATAPDLSVDAAAPTTLESVLLQARGIPRSGVRKHPPLRRSGRRSALPKEEMLSRDGLSSRPPRRNGVQEATLRRPAARVGRHRRAVGGPRRGRMVPEVQRDRSRGEGGEQGRRVHRQEGPRSRR